MAGRVSDGDSISDEIRKFDESLDILRLASQLVSRSGFLVKHQSIMFYVTQIS